MHQVPVTKELNDKMDVIADAARSEFPNSCVICLVIDEEGNAHYVSNLDRADAIDALQTFVGELKEAKEEPQEIYGMCNAEWPFPTGNKGTLN